MQIKEIFKKEISRPINGVVKAEELKESTVWQELDEYVVTRELDQHFRKFLSAYLAAVDNARDPVVTSRIGVWVSGFFGSGKSHFIKILSYLLANRKAIQPDRSIEKKAVDFFDGKIKDPMLLGDLKRIAGMDTEVILFNIDSKADTTADGRSAVLSTFWRVFNESQGFCGDSLHLAEIERYLTQKGKFDQFKEQFHKARGDRWEDERDAYALYQDEIAELLADVLETSPQAAGEWFEKAEKDFKLTVENFAKRVKEYLDTRSPSHRIVFLVDEIGQFIGSDTHLMLNLQTIVEDLGRICSGRVWVLVTSQEDIDAILGDIKASKANDFSKIQGRFNTRLSLSSSNTDEVIQARLLEKTAAAETELETLFTQKGDILKHQLSFSHDSTSFKNFSDAGTFKINYPFAPFHFQLVQNILESIRKAGATGLHLARGERSMLDAFQSAAKSLAEKEIGALVPLHEFFPCIESFLDTAVMLSINNAKDNPALKMPFDLQLLQTLFLIRYVELIKPNVDNLVTLCIDEVDADRINLKRAIEDSLERLEKQNLINRNGDLYFFLTNDEREVSREIKSVSVPSGEESQLLGEIIFEEILKGKAKHRYIPYKNDYPFNRLCDDRIWGRELKDDLGLEIISPLHDEYTLFIPAKCNLYSANKEGSIIVKLPDDTHLLDEIRIYLQTDKYIKAKSDAAASSNLKQILRNRAEENRSRRERLTSLIDELILRADFYAMGKSLEIKAQTTQKALDEAFDHLIKNVFSKYGYLAIVAEDPLAEIKQILSADDITQQQLSLDFENNEPRDIKELRTFIELKTTAGQRVILTDLVRHFAKRPYGWGDFQIVILVAKLYMAAKIGLRENGTPLNPEDAVAYLTKTPQWKNVKIVQRVHLSREDTQKAHNLAKELFGAIPPEGQDQIARHLRAKLGEWSETLKAYKPLADTGKYPGKPEIDQCLRLIEKLIVINDAYEIVKAFNAESEDLRDASDDLCDLQGFYQNQRSTWESLLKAMENFKPNRSALEKDTAAASALNRMDQIVKASAPYEMLKEANDLIAKVDGINEQMIEAKRKVIIEEIDGKIAIVKSQLETHSADADIMNQTLRPFQEIKKKISAEYSIPQIVTYGVGDVQDVFEAALESIDDIFKPKTKPPKKAKPIKTIKPSSLKQKAYFDTEEDVEVFIGAVRQALLNAVKENLRIRIE